MPFNLRLTDYPVFVNIHSTLPGTINYTITKVFPVNAHILKYFKRPLYHLLIVRDREWVSPTHPPSHHVEHLWFRERPFDFQGEGCKRCCEKNAYNFCQNKVSFWFIWGNMFVLCYSITMKNVKSLLQYATKRFVSWKPWKKKKSSTQGNLLAPPPRNHVVGPLIIVPVPVEVISG